ncbi:MAG: phosphoribosylanthranilate isomerase [Candidatus Acidiferrales bacterium]
MVKVKICGITNWTDARRAVEAGADFLGFNFCRASPRYIAPAAARRIVRRLRAEVASVGVFVNEAESEMLGIARRVGLDYVQLHGDETAEVVARMRRNFRVIKAIRVRGSLRAAQLERFERASSFLLDGFDRRVRGGSGKSFDWKLAKRVGRGRQIFLAGGLTPENAAEAVTAARPFAIDVCSGVESRPGKKDAARMRELVSAVRAVRPARAAAGTRRKARA